MLKINRGRRLPHEQIERFGQRLVNVCERFGFIYTQVNGQRVCTTMRTREKPNLKGTEIFIGKIPRNTFEDELIPLFLQAGELYQFRLMLDFTLKNRGFAFATYMTSESAERAIQLFDNYEIRPKFKMGVFKSVDNCRLFFGNIPPSYTKADMYKILSDNSIQGITEIIMYKDLLKPQFNRGYVFVEFSSHRDAAMARKQLYPGCLIVEGQAIFVDWADPIPDVDPKVMAQVTKLFIRDLPIDLSKNGLCAFLGRLVDMSTVHKVHKQMDYAFIHFDDRESAEAAKKALAELPFSGVVVEWARPREYSKQLRLESPPTNFCLSLPPKMRRHYQQYINSIISDTSSNESQSLSPTSSQQGSSTGSVSPRAIEEGAVGFTTRIKNQMKAGAFSSRMNNQMGAGTSSSPVNNQNEIKIGDFSLPGPSFRRMSQPYSNQHRSSTPIANRSFVSPSSIEEKPSRNPLIGLPISPIPIRNLLQATPPPAPMMIQEKTNYNDVLYPNVSWRTQFSLQPLYNNNSLFQDHQFQQRDVGPMVSSGRSTPILSNQLLESSCKPFF